MKKYFLITVVVLSLLMFQGCSKSSSKNDEPTKAVTAFMDNLIQGDFAKASENCEEELESIDGMENNPIVDLLFGQLKYEVIDSNITDDTATVKIKVTHPKFEELVAVIPEAVSSIDISDINVEDQDLEKSQEMLKEAIKEVTKDKEFGTEENEAEVELKLVDNKWVISKDCDLSGMLGVQQ